MDYERPKIVFDPDDRSRVRFRKDGPVDAYEEILPSSGLFDFGALFPMLQTLKDLVGLRKERRHVERILRELASIEGSLPYFLLPLLLQLFQSIMPALSLWYATQFLKMFETAIEERQVDTDALLRMAADRAFAHLAQKVLEELQAYTKQKLDHYIECHFDLKKFEYAAKFDLPTLDNPRIQSILYGEEFIEDNWAPVLEAPQAAIALVSSLITLATSATVLFGVMKEHSGMRFLLFTGIARVVFDTVRQRVVGKKDRLYVYKTRDRSFTNSRGFRYVFTAFEYRKEMVANDLTDFFLKQYRECMHTLGQHSHCHTHECRLRKSFYKDGNSVTTKALELTAEPLGMLGEIYTCIRVVNHPSSAPVSLATLRFIQGAVDSLFTDIKSLRSQCETLITHVKSIGDYYSRLDTENLIKDGTIPFPENQLDLKNGISVEFKNVSFKYTEDSETMVLQDVSFKIEQGQLCVIVGENGSGKSTILALMTRIYDINEGQILLNGLDIRTLKLADIRKAMAVLFQDYTLFPFTLGENIWLGDPKSFGDLEKMRQAAKLGGADDFIEGLTHKYETYVSRPVWDTWIEPREDSDSMFAGKEIDFSKLNLNDLEQDLSGGQKQRIAMQVLLPLDDSRVPSNLLPSSRTFMKSVVSEENSVGLLLFDEPSASLDPKAEHELFSRLRELRGSKTMVFSSHRFGKLTRHADLILYVQKGEVVEAGTHATLMKKEDGQYAKFWNIQAEDFL